MNIDNQVTENFPQFLFTVREINVDSGDYIPVPVGALATLLRAYADVIERRQEEINHQGGDQH